MTNIDFHNHLRVYSPCSQFDKSELKMLMSDMNLSIVGITDHETIKGAQALKKEAKFIVITGMEVTTGFGDFLVFSKDKEYMKKLSFDYEEEGSIVMPRSLKDMRSDKDSVIIWAHPHIRDDKDEMNQQEIDYIMTTVDAIELCNGSVMTALYAGRYQAKEYLIPLWNLAQKYNKPCTGSSDTHASNQFMKCWTAFEADIKTQSDFVDAIKSGKFKPVTCEDYECLIKDLKL